MRMKTCVCKTFAFVFSKESTVAQYYVIDFIAGTFSIETVPFFRRLLTLPISQMKPNIQVDVFTIQVGLYIEIQWHGKRRGGLIYE